MKTKNLPAFTKSDLVIEVGSGASKVSPSPETVSQDAGSCTTSTNLERREHRKVKQYNSVPWERLGAEVLALSR